MTILHIVNQFGGLTGSELHVSDLAKQQASSGHKVFIHSLHLLSGPLIKEVESVGVTITDDVEIVQPDIIHAHSAKSAIVGSTLGAPVIQTIHSELFPFLDYPVVNRGVKHYICIRPTIQELALKLVKKENTSVIFNGVDPEKFYPVEFKSMDVPTVLFVGPNDYLRELAIARLVNRAEKGLIYLILVGRDQRIDTKNIISLPEMSTVNLLTQKCDQTASIMLGRTTIEGWMCGKPGIVFTVNDEGEILDEDLLSVPSNLEEFTIEAMSKRIMKVYKKYIKES